MFPCSMASKPTFGANEKRGMVGGRIERHVHYGVEHETPVGPSVLGHGLDDGRSHAAAPMRRVHRHGHLGAARVVAQRHLHHADAEDRAAVGLPRGRAGRSASTGCWCCAKARMSGSVKPIRSGQRSSSLARRTAVHSASSLSSAWVDQAYLHRTTLPLRPPFSAGRRRTPRPRRRCSAVAQLAHFFVGQGAVVGAEAQPVGQAPRTLVDTRATVDVEEMHRLQELAADSPQRVGHGIGRMLVVHDEGQIDVRGREAADRAADRDAAGHLLLVEEHAQVDLEPADTPGRGPPARLCGSGRTVPPRRGRSPRRSRW